MMARFCRYLENVFDWRERLNARQIAWIDGRGKPP